VDAMLGDVAKWLRILGYYTIYRADFSDEDVIKLAERHDLMVITRDRGLFRTAQRKGIKVILLPTFKDDVEMLAFLARSVGIRLYIDLNKTRCPKCNGSLSKRRAEDIKTPLPSAILKAYDVFFVCENCGAVYWQGSHYKSMLKILSEARLLRERGK